jgi:hypothetical protein
MISFAVKQTMSEEDWKDHVLGSGAFSWEWWYSVEETLDGILVGWYDDIDSSDNVESKFLTYQQIADKCSELAQTHQMVSDQLLNDDFDADGMDVVLQYAFIGEIRYG